MSSKQNRRRSPVAIVLLVLGATLVAGLIAELALRLLWRQPAPLGVLNYADADGTPVVGKDAPAQALARGIIIEVPPPKPRFRTMFAPGKDFYLCYSDHRRLRNPRKQFDVAEDRDAAPRRFHEQRFAQREAGRHDDLGRTVQQSRIETADADRVRRHERLHDIETRRQRSAVGHGEVEGSCLHEPRARQSRAAETGNHRRPVQYGSGRGGAIGFAGNHGHSVNAP